MRQQAEQLESGERKDANQRSPPSLMPEVPWAYVQDVMGVQGVVITAFILRLIHRDMQFETNGKPVETTEEISRHSPMATQSATDNDQRYSETPT